MKSLLLVIIIRLWIALTQQIRSYEKPEREAREGGTIGRGQRQLKINTTKKEKRHVNLFIKSQGPMCNLY